jgi:hypothetical protein
MTMEILRSRSRSQMISQSSLRSRTAYAPQAIAKGPAPYCCVAGIGFQRVDRVVDGV